MGIIAAILRKVNGLFQVVRLHSALTQGNMKVHNLRQTGNGRYLVRVSAGSGHIKPVSKSAFADYGIMRKSNTDQDRFAEYYLSLNNVEEVDSIDSVDTESLSISPYTTFDSERAITTRKGNDWGLLAVLRSFGCDVDQAELIGDAGYGSSWIAVDFNPA